MTTYVLGAGASFHAGYPLCSELWPKMVTWLIETFPADDEYRRAIDTITAVGGPVTDIEALFTNLDVGRGPFRGLSDVQRGRVGGRIRRCLGDYFKSICIQNQGAELYSAFAKRIAKGDTFITFNYDTSLENELIRARRFRVRNGYGSTLTADWDELDSDVTVLKLHGSVNWTAALFDGMTSGPRSVSNSLGKRPFVDNTDSCFPDYPNLVLDKGFPGGGIAKSATLILPTYDKEFSVKTALGVEWVDFYESLWEQASCFLEKADRVVIIGYSMPDADYRAGSMLLWNMNKRAEIVICCSSSNEKMTTRFRGHGFSRTREIRDFADLIDAWPAVLNDVI